MVLKEPGCRFNVKQAVLTNRNPAFYATKTRPSGPSDTVTRTTGSITVTEFTLSGSRTYCTDRSWYRSQENLRESRIDLAEWSFYEA
jgi:hypothetical protein